MTSSYTFFVHNVCITQVCFHCSIGKPCDSFLHLFSQCGSVIYILYVTVHEKTRYKLKIATLNNANLKVQTLCCFMLKSDWPNGDKITSVQDNAILSSAFYSSLFILISSETKFSQKKKVYLVFSCTVTYIVLYDSLSFSHNIHSIL